MPVILSATADISSTQAPDAYIQIQNPPSFIQGAPTDIAACVGTASWGPLNTPSYLGDPLAAIRTFGRVSSAALTDLHDLATDLGLAFAQGNDAPLAMIGVRVSDGTDSKATAPLLASDASAGATATALYSGTEGNNVSVVFQTGSKSGTITTIVRGFSGGPNSEVYPNIAAPGGGGFWTSLASAINFGMSGVRGPSQIVRITSAHADAVGPAVGFVTLSGGADGRSVTVSNLLGSDTSFPKTGIYSLRGVTPSPSVAWVAGLVDNSTATAGKLAAFGDSEAIVMGYAMPAGTSSDGGISDRQNWGIDTPNFIPLKDHHYFWDNTNNMVRLVPPYPFVLGRTAALAAQESPLNKQVYETLGTERNDPTTGNVPYSEPEIGQLNAAGICFVTKPIPAGNVFGIRTGVNASSDPVKQPIEYARYTNKLAKTFAGFVGKYVGLLQSIAPDDELRLKVFTDFCSFLKSEKEGRALDSFKVVCDLTNNPPAAIAKHYLYVTVRVRYLSSVWYFIVGLQGGTTVVTQGASLGQALAA